MTPTSPSSRPTSRHLNRVSRLVLLITLLGAISGCGSGSADQSPLSGSPLATGTRSALRLATTTSTADTGLLDALLPDFESAHNVRVDVIAVGTGQALKLGQRGDVDVLLVHAAASEHEFLEAGHAIRRDDVMYNTFLLLGPTTDPAGIRGQSVGPSLAAICRARARFVSRGDDSGTHKRELALWESVGGLETWSHYVETGRGMGQTLITANQMQAHVLCDRGTYLKLRDKISLVPLVEGDVELHNPYGVLVINPEKHPMINVRLATELANYLVSDSVQQQIAAFRIQGEPLFHPHPRGTR